uniref:Putative conjugative transfer protein TrbL n=1 Tax=Ralstonia solanacearum PSI07 TaxID=859657 RepID=D8MYC8_RALSL|nr:P-type conjugative transfer protein TrbL [Ralstonia solanacearum]CBJ34344.1 putative conjugative transfer protein TrbL [Ralstonia solanacearum PSI07]
MKYRLYLPLLLLLTIPMATYAADASTALGLDNSLMDTLKETLAGMENALRDAAYSLVGPLAVIDVGLWSIKKIKENDDTPALVLQFMWNVMVWSFFIWAIGHSHDLMSKLIQGFFAVGQNGTGLGDLDAPGMLGLGVKASLALLDKASIGALDIFDKPLIVLTALVAMLMMLIAFFVTAAQLVMAQVETVIVITVAPILFSFGALSFTREMAVNVIKYCISTGIKIVVIYVLAGFMVKMGPIMANVLKANADQLMSSPGHLLAIIGISGLMVLLSFQIPTIASSMLSGSSGMSGGAMIGAALGAAAAAATGGAAAAAGLGGAAKAAGGAATGAAAGAAGLVQALDAGLASAGDQGLSGMAAGGHALGQVAGHGLGMAGGAIGSAAESAKSAFGGKVDQSIGGKIASSIQAGRGGSVAGVPSPSTDAGSSSTTATASTPAPAPQNSASSVSSSPGAPSDASPQAGGAPAPQNSASMDSSAPGAPGGASPQADVAPAPEAGPVAEAGPTPSGNVPASAAYAPAPGPQGDNLAGYTPAGDASSVAVSGAAQAQRPPSTLGRVTDALNRAGNLLDASKDHIIEDNTAVSASIDHRA